MKKQTVFIKRYPSNGELPDKDGIIVITTNGRLKYNKTFGWITLQNYTTKAPEWWLEEIELPSEDEVKAELTHPVNISVNVSTLLRDMYEHGVDRTYKFILNKLKGETK